MTYARVCRHFNTTFHTLVTGFKYNCFANTSVEEAAKVFQRQLARGGSRTRDLDLIATLSGKATWRSSRSPIRIHSSSLQDPKAARGMFTHVFVGLQSPKGTNGRVYVGRMDVGCDGWPTSGVDDALRPTQYTDSRLFASSQHGCLQVYRRVVQEEAVGCPPFLASCEVRFPSYLAVRLNLTM